jgi:hypothetical protein
VDSLTLTPSPAPLPYLCPWGCGRSFETKDAANGHGRHCPVRAAKRAGTLALAAGATAASVSQDVGAAYHQDGDEATPDHSRS